MCRGDCNDCRGQQNRCRQTRECTVRYTGPDIDCLGITTNDSFETIVSKISEFTCENVLTDGVGIENITYSEAEDTLTITMTDGTVYNFTGLKGTDANIEVEAGDNVTVDKVVNGSVTTYTINAVNCCGLIEGTYEEFATLISEEGLEEGRHYKMTDFETIYDQPDYINAITPKTTVVTKSAGVDPIMLLAISTSEFAKEVWRPSTPNQILHYDFNFYQTEYMNVPAKGRITYCKDEFDNETHYDHTVVLLKRYESESGSGIFNSSWDTGFASTEVLTFGAGSFSNKIGDNYYELGGVFAISNNVLGVGSLGNSIGVGSKNNTFGNSTQNNTFGNNTYNNTFGNNTYNNTFGDDTSNNTFGDDTSNNTFGNSTYNNTFGNSTNNNTFGNIIQSVDFTITPTPTHVYGSYPCNIFKRQDDTVRLSYYDNTDALIIVNPTD